MLLATPGHSENSRWLLVGHFRKDLKISSVIMQVIVPGFTWKQAREALSERGGRADTGRSVVECLAQPCGFENAFKLTRSVRAIAASNSRLLRCGLVRPARNSLSALREIPVSVSSFRKRDLLQFRPNCGLPIVAVRIGIFCIYIFGRKKQTRLSIF